MDILYVSTLCSEKKFERLSNTGTIKPDIAVQKFHQLLANGFVLNDCHIQTISSCPVNRSSHKRIFWKKEMEKINGIEFHYLPFINYPFLKQFIIFISGFIGAIRWLIKNKGKEKIIICDVLNVAVSASALLAARLFRIHIVGIVTDLPHTMLSSQRGGLLEKMAMGIDEIINNSYTSYVMLTKQMCRYINRYSCPSCIIEGVVDVNMKKVKSDTDKAFRNIIYAGSLYEEYGVRQLIEAFRHVKGDNLRLSIYGSGEMEKEMDLYMKLDSRLHFYGVVPNTEIMKEELKATLLVNPRFSKAEYTKYSFPSKNLEYMSSGVPVLTTCLPGMPKDYHNYIYLFTDESINGYVRALTYVLSLPDEDLKSKGQSAKEFVLREKNNVSQTKKILDMVFC